MAANCRTVGTALTMRDEGKDILGQRAAAHAERPAVTLGRSGSQITYGDMGRRSSQLARFFRSLGLVRGDVVAIVMENNLEFLQVAWAAQRSGLYYAAVNWHLSAEEVAYILHDCGAQVLVTSRQMSRRGCRPRRTTSPPCEWSSAWTASCPSPRTRGRTTFAFDDEPLDGRLRGLRAPLLLRHHGAAEGRQAPPPAAGRAGPEPRRRRWPATAARTAPARTRSTCRRRRCTTRPRS